MTQTLPQSSSEFVHLHVHSEYSLLDGLSSVEQLVAEAARQGMRALALTDHGNLFGAIEFFLAAQEAGLKPILGMEAYVAPRAMTDRAAADRGYNHLVLLARNEDGYHNLLKLATAACLEGFYYKPRVDRELLAAHHKGLIALSACYTGEPAQAVLRDDPRAAREAAGWYRQVFGKSGYFLELQDHGNDQDQKVNRGLLELSRDLDIPIVATNDIHYALPTQADAQDLLLCIQTNSVYDDPKRMRMQPAAYYLKSPEEMHALFSELPEALSNTLEIAERCTLKLKFGRLNFPTPTHLIPGGESPEDFLEQVCRQRLPRGYAQVTDQINQRLEYELGVIRKTGFAAYILFVWDFVDWARQQGIRCAPRGSAAGSLVLYCLGVSEVDPLAHGLMFERFLNPERGEMPDIDMDFADDRRDEVINYVVQRYGRDHVAQIITFGRLLARAAIRDAGRALAYPLAETDRVAKLIPLLPLGITIDKALEQSRELQQLYDTQPDIRRLIDLARSVEGVARHAGTHAAGVVVAGEPLVNHAPLQRVAKGDGVMTQYPMKALEKIGLLKMDFLGLANLTMLETAARYIDQARGVKLEVSKLPLDDARTYEMLARGETRTVFQLEGAGMTRALKQLRPENINQLADMIALYRPGPMAHIQTYLAAKAGTIPVSYAHPSLEPILKETYGVIVYQDQVLQIVQRVAGYSLGRADILRHAMGKKNPEEMRRERNSFLQGARQRNFSAEVANQLWEYIEPFAGYAFNKSHAYVYAHTSYQTAYMKANYPVEWMAAVLTTEALDTDKVVAGVGECRRMGIPVLPPDLNLSQTTFSVERIANGDGDRKLGIRYGLAAIKNVGEGAIQQLVAQRELNGRYASIRSLCSRLDLKTFNKRVLESLTRAGATDSLGARERVLAGLDQAMALGQHAQKAQSLGQASLFDPVGADSQSLVNEELPAAQPITLQQRLAWEKEVLGLYLSEHPFQEASRSLASRLTADSSQIGPELGSEKVTAAGLATSVRRITTRKKESMAIAELEDLHGSFQVVVFPRVYERTADAWRPDRVLVVQGRADSRGDARQLICESVEVWQPGEPSDDAPPPSVEPPDVSLSQPESPVGPIPETQPTPTALNGAAQVEADQPPGNGGAGRDSAHSDSGEEQAAATTPGDRPVARVRLRLSLPRTGDDVADVQKLETAYRLLEAAPGSDPYQVYLTARGRRVCITEPAAATRHSPELESALRDLLGEQNVDISSVQ